MNHRWPSCHSRTTQVFLVMLGVWLAACAPRPAPSRLPRPTPPPRVAERPSPPPQDRGVSVSYGELIRSAPPTEQGQTAALEEPDVGAPADPGTLPDLPMEKPDIESLPDESLAPQIKSAKAPNIAAALRLVEEGRGLMNQQRYDQALDLFERSVSVDPSSFYGYYYLARLHYATKDYSQAVAFANRATTLGARGDRVWLGRAYTLQGMIFEDVGRFSDARSAYQRAVGTDPANTTAAVGRARLTPRPPRVEPAPPDEDPWH